jgi:hypothetical protein
MAVNMMQSAAKNAGRDWRAGITADALEEQLKKIKRPGGGGSSDDDDGEPGSEQDSRAVRFFNLTPNQLGCHLVDDAGEPLDEGGRDVFPAAYDENSWVSKLL